MKIIWSNKIDTILKIGYPLDAIGVNNWALSKSDALIALEQFEKFEIAVLGGGVCEFENNFMTLNYDSWYCEKNINEAISDFVLRSIATAKDYIENYRTDKPNRILFTIVPEI